MTDIGIRREDKNQWERRAPLTPAHVQEITADLGLTVAVEPSPLRIFSDDAYRAAGATLTDDLSPCKLILGVKEVPPQKLLPAKPYLFFSHVIKGQDYNMPLLRRLLDLRCTLMDYESIVDRNGRRLIFFGRHAGYAGMVDALHALGQRMLAEGVETAFASVRPSYKYASVEAAKEHLANQVGRRIRERGLRAELYPLVVGFTGGGNVSQGAQAVFDRLPVVEIDPADLPKLAGEKGHSRHAVYKVVFRRADRENFARHLPFLTVLVNGVYWEPTQPRLVTREDLRRLWAADRPPRLCVIADISCDINGSIAATVRPTTPEAPVFVYNPETGQATDGVRGRGPVVMAVDNLPTEFPRDASEHFGDSLFPFLAGLVAADFTAPFEHLALPAAVLGAAITHAGELTPHYRYLRESLQKAGV